MLPNISPKLEDFLGSANHGREATALSLDSIYYNQNDGADAVSERQHCLNLFKQQEQHILFGMFQFPAEDANKESHIASHSYEIRHALEQRIDRMSSQDVEPLSLSMSPGSQSSCVTAPTQNCHPGLATMETKKRGLLGRKKPVHRKSIDTFGQRTSQYRGVSRLF